MNIKIGCTGWSYSGWSGTFYPRNLKSSEIFSFLTSLVPIHEKVSALILQLPPSLSFEEAKPRLGKL
ncbi:MAG: hypothetical protein OEL81_03045 [Nitrosopumilus sp.]|nr:hypothetical protein [Nitrosopumilus sp.]